MLPFPTGEAGVTATLLPTSYDLKDAVSANRLKGLWRLATGFRLTYLGATVRLAIGALAKTATALLLRYFVDNILGQTQQLSILLAVALGFVLLALVEGLFTFLSGKLASQTAEGIALPAAQLSVRPHPAADLQLSRQDANRRADPAQHIGCGRAAPLLSPTRRSASAASSCSSASTSSR